jgi:hypothetical protein
MVAGIPLLGMGNHYEALAEAAGRPPSSAGMSQMAGAVSSPFREPILGTGR